MSWQNFNGGFGSILGSESHWAYCFCCIGFLFITRRLNISDKIQTGKWLAERQTFLEGFNGRPENYWMLIIFGVLNNIFMIGAKTFLIKIY